jgi:serine/threonine-protein kinase SRPK3
MGKCSYPVDIWAIGCTFYELLSGKALFNPTRDSKHSRDYYHLCLMNETCGDFSPEFIKKTQYYKRFFNAKYKINNYIAPFENRLDKKIEELNFSKSDKNQIKEILKRMLTIDPIKRITIDELSSMIFFK